MGILSIFFVYQQNKISEQQKQISIKQTEIAEQSNQLAKLALEQNRPILNFDSYLRETNNSNPEVVIKNTGSGSAKNVFDYYFSEKSQNLSEIIEIKNAIIDPNQEFLLLLSNVLITEYVSIILIYQNATTNKKYLHTVNFEFSNKVNMRPIGYISENKKSPLNIKQHSYLQECLSSTDYDVLQADYLNNLLSKTLEIND